jgi:hypothetical protein
MPRIPHESEENHFKGIITGDKSWFQYSHSYPASKMFVRLPTDVIPRARQAIGTKQTMVAIFFTGCKFILLDTYQKEAHSTSYVLLTTLFPI